MIRSQPLSLQVHPVQKPPSRTHSPVAVRSAAAALLFLCFASSSCVSWFFAGSASRDRSIPVVRLDTTGGIEYAATTEYGILTLGRTAKSGPCRVHYRLGPTPLVEDGWIEPAGGVFYQARMDLSGQTVRALGRELTERDPLVAMYLEGDYPVQVSVELARDAQVEGNVLSWPGRSLPAGAALLVPQDNDEHPWKFVGLIAGEAQIDRNRYLVFTGLQDLRRMLLEPEQFPLQTEIVHRRDDITLRRRLRRETPVETSDGQ